MLLLTSVAACSQSPTPATGSRRQEGTTGTSSVAATTVVAEDATVTTPNLESFRGYGDYSGLTYHQVDWYSIYESGVACANDHGFPVRLMFDGGANFEDVPAEQSFQATMVFDSCLAGMNAPEWSWPTEEEMRHKYDYALALVPCIEAMGYDVDDPPSVDLYIEEWRTGPSWSPYENVPATGSEHIAVTSMCPAAPVGGPSAWRAGDPIAPLPGFAGS